MLTSEQITDLINNKSSRSSKKIIDVKNAIEPYHKLPVLKSYDVVFLCRAHGI